MIRHMSTADNEQPSRQRNLRVIWFLDLVAMDGFAVMILILPLYVRERGLESDRGLRLSMSRYIPQVAAQDSMWLLPPQAGARLWPWAAC